MSDISKSDLIDYINQRSPDGYNEFFYENGTLESKGTFHNHKRIGHWEWYHLGVNKERTLTKTFIIL